MEKDLYKTIINPDLKVGDEIIYNGCKAVIKRLIVYNGCKAKIKRLFPLEIQLQESIKTMEIEEK